MAREDGTRETLASFDSFVDQLSRDFRRSRTFLKRYWLANAKEGLDLSRPCTGEASDPCWLDDHLYVLNYLLGNAALHIYRSGSSGLAIGADSFAFQSSEWWGEVMFAHLVAAWIVARHSCLRELSLSFPGPECLRLLGVSRLEASDVPAAFVVNAIQNGALLESIKISNMIDSNYHVDDLVTALQGHDRLRSLELIDNRFELGSLKKVLEALTRCGRLEALAIENEKVVTEDAQALRSLLKSSRSLKTLSLTEMDSESIMAAANDLDGIFLEELHICVRGLPEERLSLNFTGALANLRVLRVERTYIGSEGAISIAQHLAGNTSLKELSLSAIRIGELGALALAEALRENSSLEQLDVSYNDLTSSALLAFAEALNVNTTLKTLHFGEICGRDEEIDHIFERDRFKDIFRRVCIVWREGRLGELCKILLADQQHPMCSLAFRDIVTPAAIDSLFSAMSVSTTVTKLDLSCSVDISPTLAKPLADFLRRNESVRWLRISTSTLSEDLVIGILEALRQNKTVSYYQGYIKVITPAIAFAVERLLLGNDALNELHLFDSYSATQEILDAILAGLFQNYTLVDLYIGMTAEVTRRGQVMLQLRRNQNLLTLCARYVSSGATGADAAEVLKKLHRSYALVKKVAEMSGTSEELARKDIAAALTRLATS